MSRASRFLALVAAGAVGAAALALWARERQLTINGTVYPDALLVSEGRSYVAVDALRQAGAQITVTDTRLSIQFQPLAGREQADAFEGFLGEWVQNDAWRIRVTKVEKVPSPFGRGPGVAVEFELRNLDRRAVSPFASGMDRLQVVDDKGRILGLAAQSFAAIYDSVPPAGSVTARALFGDPQNATSEIGEPDKLLVTFRATGGRPARKGFRIFLREPQASP